MSMILKESKLKNYFWLLLFLSVNMNSCISITSGSKANQIVNPSIIPIPLLPKFILVILTPRNIATT